MGLGRWKEKQNYPLKLKATDGLKIYGIHFENDPQRKSEDTWKKMSDKISGKLNKYKNSATTIFGRAAIVNRYITPKLIYVATTSTVPKDTIQGINHNIREFIFKNTVRTINHCTLVQNKLQGGINLHDIQTKI